jgi:signal transduction histidine kinase
VDAPLARKLTLAHVLAALIGLTAVALAAWSVARQTLEEELGRRLAAVAGAAGAGLPLDLLIGLQPGDEDSRTYRHAQDQLRSVLKSAQLRRLAVFSPQGMAICDTADAPIGSPLPDLARDRLELEQVWHGESTTSRVLFRGPDGRNYKSGYAPLRVGGEVVAGMVAEGDARFFSVLSSLGRRLAWVGGLGALLVALASLLVAASISRPLRRLVGAAQRIASGDLATPVEDARGSDGARSRDEVAFLARAFEEMRRALEDRDRQLQMMLAGIAHEVRNPLGGIELFAGLLAESLSGNAETLTHVQRIQQELAYLKRVVDDFLDYAKAPRLMVEELAPRQLLEEAATLLRPALEAKQVRCEIAADAALRVRGDRSQLHQALLNLLQNAVQASPVGGTVRLEGVLSGAQIILRVEDAGPGVPLERREEIFAPFFTTHQQGTGLGLAFVRKIAIAHGGIISVGSSGLGGARFELGLPSLLKIPKPGG